MYLFEGMIASTFSHVKAAKSEPKTRY